MSGWPGHGTMFATMTMWPVGADHQNCGLSAETLGRTTRGNGCIADYRRGAGAVFNAGSCEWVAGLIAQDRSVEQVTRNVLLGDWA